MAAWHRIREHKVKERTVLVNQMRGLIGEPGIVIAQGINHVRKLSHPIIEDMNNKLSMMARDYLPELHTGLLECDETIERY